MSTVIHGLSTDQTDQTDQTDRATHSPRESATALGARAPIGHPAGAAYATPSGRHRLLPQPSALLAVALGACLALALGASSIMAQDDPIVRVYPQPGERGVFAGTSITLYFDREIDHASLASAFAIEPTVDGEWVEQGAHGAVFNPSGPLAALTEYTATIGTGALDRAGRPLFTRPFTWSFSTGMDTAAATFSGSLPIRFVGATGDRDINVDPGYQRITVDLTLYSIDFAGFAQRYALMRPWAPAPIDVTGLTQVATWETFVDRGDPETWPRVPADVPPGYYVLDVRADRVMPAQAIVVLTDHALVAKLGLDGTTLWLTTVPDGTPAAGAEIALRDATGAVIGGATTDVDGVVSDLSATSGDAAFATADIGGQPALVGLDGNWASGYSHWRSGSSGGADPTEARITGNTHTDRPIYRPGHTVHWKSTLRRVAADGEGYDLLDSTTAVTATLKDARDRVVATTSPTLDDFGSVSGEWILDQDASLGYWTLEVQADGHTTTHRFQVEAYVKPDYEVNVTSDKPWYVRGDSAVVSVQADYYFGRPVVGAAVVLRIYQGHAWWGGSAPVTTLEGTLDEDGSWTATVPLTDSGDSSTPVFFEAEVVDASRRPVVSEHQVTVYPAEIELTLRSQRYGLELGETGIVEVGVADHAGLPMAGVDVMLELRQYQGRGETTLRRETLTTDAAGAAEWRLDGLEVGWYQIYGTAVDARGNRVQQTTYLWLWDERYAWGWYGGFELSLDKPEYQAGDTATLLVRSPVTGTHALVTVERDSVRHERVVRIDGPTAIELPVSADYAPNVEVKVALWQPLDGPYNTASGQLLISSVQLIVPADDKRLDVAVAPSQAELGPGEEASVQIRVTDSTGAPVRAQVSLALVDKAVLALATDTSQSLEDAFWSGWPNGVLTLDSLGVGNAYRGWPEEDRGGGLPAPGAGPPASPEPSDPDTPNAALVPRREFPDTAYWRADIETDAEGTATIALTLPDSLTTWVAVARAVSLETEVGVGKAEIIVSKDIQADLALPRFAVQGDEFALDVLARQYVSPADALAATCVLDAPSLVALDPGSRELALDYGETGVARWSVVASTLGESIVRADLTTPAGSDALEMPFEVQPFAVPERFVLSGSTDTKAAENIDIPYDTMADASSLEIRLSPGAALGVLDGLEDLIGYPYGCVEQTMSRQLPNAVVGRLVEELGLEAPEIQAQLPELMALGIQKLAGFQGPDGAWGWWGGAYSDPQIYLTSYVLHGLTLTEQAGFDVDDAVIDAGFAWLAANIEFERDPRMKAYALYVMSEAGRTDVDATVLLSADVERMDAFALASLALAQDAAGRSDLATSTLDRLEGLAVQSATTVHWPLTTTGSRWDEYHWRSMASAEKNTGAALLALSRLRPGDEMGAKAARWLLEHRWGRGWSSTQATAFAIVGLTDHLVTSGELDADFTWTVAVDDLVLATGSVTPETVLDRIDPVRITGDDLLVGERTLRIEKAGRGTLFYTAVGDLRRFKDGFEPTEAAGLGIDITRSYTGVVDRAAPDGWRVGDVVNVQLKVKTTEDLWYVVVEDMLPAGLEAMNEALATESDREPGGEPGWGRGLPWRWWGYERKELRDDKVSFFATQLPAGEHLFEYAARAITPGTFSARPAEGYAMYRPEVWGRSGAEQITIATRAVLARPPLAGDIDRDCRLTAFDASLIAAEWAAGGGARKSVRDIDGNGVVGAGDIALAAARGAGALACGDAVPAAPGERGAIELALEAMPGGGPDEIVIKISADGVDGSDGSDGIGAWELTLELPEGLKIERVEAGTLAAGGLPLGPSAEDGTVRFGGWDVGGTAAGGTDTGAGDANTLAVVTLRDTRGGTDVGDVAVVGAEIAHTDGAAYAVTSDGAIVSPPARGYGIWLPWVARGALVR